MMSDESSPHIGTLSERSLHAALKDWYARPGDRLEVKVDGYVIDVVRDDLLIEIQTAGFHPLKTKLRKLLPNYRVRLVHPIVARKTILRLAADGETLIQRRRSPQRGKLEHIFLNLVSLHELPAHDAFELDVLLTEQEEIQRDDGEGSWRRRGRSIIDRRLVEVTHQELLVTLHDYAALLPTDLPGEFTNHDLAEALNQRIKIAQTMTYSLRKIGVLKLVGKRGRSNLHARLI